MRGRWALAASSLCLSWPALAAGATSPVPGVPVPEKPVPVRLRPLLVPTYDGVLRRLAPTKAHWTTAGGNGSEVLARASAAGRLLEFGGDRPFASDDGGRTWRAVALPLPTVLAGEGSIVAGGAGTAYGVGWAPYAGDQVQAVRYAPGAGWSLSEAPAHTPLYDRPWITYAKGPFTIGGITSPFVTVIHGGSNQKDSSTLLSQDGATYLPTLPSRDVGASPAVPYRIRVVRDPDADQWQPSPYAYTVPLTAGGLLLLHNPDDGFGCPVARLDQLTGRWGCVTLPFTPSGTLRQDSRGWLTMVGEGESPGDVFVLGVSPDGGVHWRQTVLRAPHGGAPKGSFRLDVVVNGRLGQAVVTSRLLDARGRGQDVVWRVDVSGRQPRVLRVYELGRGDIAATNGADFTQSTSSADRVDFPTVALLPDGAVAASFTDSTTPNDPAGDDDAASHGLHSPALAVIEP